MYLPICGELDGLFDGTIHIDIIFSPPFAFALARKHVQSTLINTPVQMRIICPRLSFSSSLFLVE